MNKVNNKSSTKSWKQQKKDFFAWVHSKPNTPTKAELRATQLFQQDQILQTFLPQVPVFINPQRKYVMDYFSMKYLCAIEIDGSYHNIQRQRHKDKVRRGKIGMLAGIKLWRITNNKILNSGLDTVEKLKLKIIKRQKSLAASQGKFEHIGQQLFLINRVLNKIDNKMFKLPRSIRWR
ncbi:MAG: DUF559 domain-containing protein, partial [Candidatus Dadabacteria bacterium]|nr:DUF559 domain-containing protein [Candidatus Dadabacteria bacterium]